MKSTQKLVTSAILTALVILLQYMGSFVRFGPFSISLVLIPIVIGAATCGVKVGTWLGFIFGLVVLMSGDAGAFLAINVWETILTVLLKGIACGFLAGIIYKWVNKLSSNNYLSTIAAAIVCPIANTGVFLIGCLLFFMETIAGWTASAGFGGDVAHYMIFVLVGANFLFELFVNIVLSPAVVQIMKGVKR